METEHDQTGHRLMMLLLERLRQGTLQRELVVLTQALLDPALAIQLLLVLLARATHLPALENLALQAIRGKQLLTTQLETAVTILMNVLHACLILQLAAAPAPNHCQFARTLLDLITAVAWLAMAILTSESLHLARLQSVLTSTLFLDLSST